MGLTSYQIRRAKLDDIPQICELAFKEFAEERAQSVGMDFVLSSLEMSLKAIIAAPALGFCLVAEGKAERIDGIFIGQFSCFILDLIRPICHELMWYVREDCRGAGVGYALLAEAENEARKKGAKVMGLGAPMLSRMTERLLKKYKELGYIPFQVESFKNLEVAEG